MSAHKKNIKNPYLPYEQAREFVRNITPAITSRAQYLKWHKEYAPGFLPRWPHHVWDNFSWNDFLGTTNSFEKTLLARKGMTRKYRPYWEGVRYAQAQAKRFNLKTRNDWMEFYDNYELPDDIPKRPWQEYEEFDINVWLGKTIEGKVKTEREGNVAIVAIHHVVGQPANVVEPRVWKDGYTAMRETMTNDNGETIGKIYRAFEVDDDNTIRFVISKIEQHGHKRDRGYVVPNINALLWDLIDLKIVKV